MLKTRTRQQTAIPDLHEHPRVKAEHDKMSQLQRRRDNIEIELEGMKGQSPFQRKRDEAIAIIENKTAPSKDEKPVRADLLYALEVIEEAQRIQQERIRAVEAEVSRELRPSLTQQRGELLRDVDGAIASLVEALKALETFYEECERSGVTPHYGLGTPWRSTAIGLGDPRWVIERLDNWRKEFAADQFTVS